MVVQEKSKEERQRHWTPRDLSILTLIMQQRAIRLDQLPRFIALFEATDGSTHDAHMKSTAHNLVERLQREGLLHLQRFGKGQPWIWLTKKGLHALGSSSSWKCPARRAFPLLYAVNAVRLQLTEHDPQGTWMSQQQLRNAFSFKEPHLVPTAALETGEGEWIAIHVVFQVTATEEQIAARMLQQLEQKKHQEEPSYSALWYYAPISVAKLLRAARARIARVATKETARKICIFSYPLVDRPVLYCGHRAPVRALAWSRDGKWLASASEDETLHIWKATTGKEQFRVPIPASPSVVAWSCDASWIGLGDEDGGLSFWTGSTGKEALIGVEASEKITGLAWSPQHNDLVAWCSASGVFQLHNVRQNAFQWRVKCIHGAEALAWSPDGSRLAVGGNDSTVCLFNATTGKPLRTFKKHRTVVHALAWSPDSQLLASSANDHAVLIWDATTGKQRRTIWSRLNAMGFLAWSPDGTRLACAGSGASSVQVWDVNTGRLLQIYTDHADEITSIAWSPDSTMLASASDDGTIHVYPAVKSSL